jgi:hypothetical protein
MDRHEQIDVLYRETHGHLRRIVSAAVNTTATNVDDACAFAWSQLTRRHLDVTVSAGITRWLATTATREAIRLDRLDRRYQPLPDFDLGRAGEAPSASAALETREAIQELLASATARWQLRKVPRIGRLIARFTAAESASARHTDGVRRVDNPGDPCCCPVTRSARAEASLGPAT